MVLIGQQFKKEIKVRRHVCTAEHKLEKPRPLAHTPLGPGFYGALHSTHKQRVGNVWKRLQDGGQTGQKQHISTDLQPKDGAETKIKDSSFILVTVDNNLCC